MHNKTFRALLSDMRWLRISHYILMLFLGGAIALSHTTQSVTTPTKQFILTSISIIFACLFSIITNNISDIRIDKISNPSRPLIKNTISIQSYRMIAIIALFLSIVLAFFVNYQAGITIILFISIYYLYSMPPVRFKRIPIFSKLAISINSLLFIFLGYLLVAGSTDGFPLLLLLLFLIGFTFAANFIDIKDYKGDAIEGIKTLPVLLGPKKSALLISIFVFATYLSFYFFIKNIYFLLMLIIGGCLQLYFINKKNYDERPIFLIYLTNLVIMIALLLKKHYSY